MRLILKILILLFSLLFVYHYVCHCNDNNCESIFPKYITDNLDFAQIKKKRDALRQSATATKEVKAPKPTALDFAKPLIAKDGETVVFKLEKENNFTFLKNIEKPANKKPMRKVIRSLKRYIEANPQKNVNIIGNYSASEKKVDNFDNLGQARAETLKTDLIEAGLPNKRLSTTSRLESTLTYFNDSLLLGGIDFAFEEVKEEPAVIQEAAVPPATDSTTNNIDTTSTDTTSIAPKDTTSVDTTTVAPKDTTTVATKDTSKVAPKDTTTKDTTTNNDTTAFKIGNEENDLALVSEKVGFEEGSATPEITEDIRKGFRSVGSYLKKNPTREIDLTGKYTTKEKQETGEDLGLKRANAVKDELAKEGSPKNQINTSSKEVAKLKKGDNGLITKVTTSKFKVNEATAKSLEELEQALYFDSNSYNLQLTAKLKQYFRDVKTYLDQNETTAIKLTGHTDDTDTEEHNQKLGKSRAETVKEKLAEMGIDKKHIQTFSEGEKKPIKTNKTEEGKAINRRVEIIIIKK